MREYLVVLEEQPGDEFPIRFYCYADDSDHALEQAENAYTNCVVLTISEV